MESITTLPAGRYYIGDPSYAFDKTWGNILNETSFFNNEPCKIGKHLCAAGATADGDGLYKDQNGFEYPVDAGMIGILPIVLLRRERKLNITKIAKEKYGRIMDFEKPFEVIIKNGKFNFGGILIDTTGEDEDDEEEYRSSRYGY